VQERERHLGLSQALVLRAIGQPPVLIGDRAPPEDRHRLVGHRPVDLDRIDLGRLDQALVDPLVAEVEAIAEPLAGLHARQHLRGGVIEHVLPAEVLVREPDDVAVGQLEVVEV